MRKKVANFVLFGRFPSEIVSTKTAAPQKSNNKINSIFTCISGLSNCATNTTP